MAKQGRPAKYVGCSVEGCSNSHYARGYCSRHYAQATRGRKLTLPEEKPEFCPGPECGRPVTTKGLCNTHYIQKWQGKELTVIKAWRTETNGDKRKCKTCQQWKNYEADFYRASNGGKQGECKTCMIKRNSANQERRKLEKKKLLIDA